MGFVAVLSAPITAATLSKLDLRQLCRHNFEHNRLAKALSIMPA